MYLSSLYLEQFRNYAELSLEFHRGPVLFVGKNSSGKTNILESIDMLSLAKSFRKTSDADLVQWDKSSFQIHAEFEKLEEQLMLDMRFASAPGASGTSGKKALLVNGAKTTLVTFLGTVLTIVFSPQDVGLLTLPPSMRRRFLDIVLCKTSVKYCAALIEYPKVIANRNKLLSAIRVGAADSDELFFWDEKISTLAAVIVCERKKFVQFINERITNLYETLAHTTSRKKQIEVEYKSPAMTREISADSPDQVGAFIRERLLQTRRQDILFGSTQVGPHRDDLIVKTDGYNLADVGSRGDQRIAVLALKLLQKDFLIDEVGTSPLLLLDDVYSELDEKRCNALTKLIADSQVFITTTSLEMVPASLQDVSQAFAVKRGVVSSLKYTHAG